MGSSNSLDGPQVVTKMGSNNSFSRAPASYKDGQHKIHSVGPQLLTTMGNINSFGRAPVGYKDGQ